MSTNNTEITDWNIDINVAGVTAASGMGPIPEGYYKAKITKMYQKADKPERIIIMVTVAEGPCTGAVRTTGINIPTNDEKGKRQLPYWRALLESVGYTPTALDKGEVKLSPTNFVNRMAHIHYVPAENEGDYDNVNFLTPTNWKEAGDRFAENGGVSPRSAASAARNRTERSNKTNTAGSAGGSVINAGDSSDVVGTAVSPDDIRASLGLS